MQAEEVQLRTQLKRLGDDLRRVNRQLEIGQKDKAILEEKIGKFVGGVMGGAEVN